MSDKIRAFFLSLTIVALLTFSAVGTITVYADDGTTTESSDAGTTTTDTGTEGDTSTTGDGQEPEGETSTTGDEQPVDVTPPASEEQPAVDAPPLLEQLPENTTVTVVGADGEALPLVSQDSAEAVLNSDPVWCPEGQSPTPGENGCTESFGSFTELLEYLEANETEDVYQQAGTIYVEEGAYLGGEESIDFNSYDFTSLNQQNLTIQGGWDTTDNSLTGTSDFTVPIIIGSDSNPWTGSLTLNNIFISGAADTGLALNSEGDITLTDVTVTESLNGADLTADGNVTINSSQFNNNTNSGANVNAGGNVDVTDSEFNNNGSGVIYNATGSGVNIQSGGAVTLSGVYANDNQLFGANIAAVQDVTVSNSFFSGNISYAFPPGGGWEHYGYGIQVITAEDIVLSGVTANENQLFGANLDGASVTITDSFFNDNGSLAQEDPTGYGLMVVSSGNVTLEGVEANENELFGANIEAGGSVIIRDSFFNGNASFQYVNNVKEYFGYGLQVVTTADIALRDVSADGNYLLGAHLEGSDIAIRDSSFSNNGSGSGLDVIGGGLEIVGINNPSYGDGAVALRDVVADNNQLFGANIQTTGDVAIGGTNNSFSGHTTYVYDSNTGNVLSISGGYGLLIIADGDIALRGITATGNYLYGASLDGFDVAITDSIFSNNGSGVITMPVGYGIKINSRGSVAINNITANNNQLFGADIVAVGDISILTGFFSGHQSVTITPCDGLTFYGYGLTAVSSAGDVILNGVEANFNNLWGASLDGSNVYIANSKFNNNISDSTQFIDDTGLIVNSRGDVTLDNVEAKENRLIGATITAVGDVYITNSTFTGNAGFTCIQVWCPAGGMIYHGYGLNVVTSGLISLDGVTANDNHLFGAHLEGANVSVSNSTFNNNGTPSDGPAEGRGLEIISGGTVTINLIEANGNQLFGANVQAVGDVTVTASDFVGNFHVVGTTPVGYGLQVITLGNITLNSDNTGYGIQNYQNGSGAILQGNNVTVTDSNFYNNGSGNGLTINATGNVTLTNVSATGNGGNGADVTTGACAIVQVNGGTFSDNAQYGLSVTGGILTLDGTQVFANNNAGNIFQNPAACAIVLSTGNETTGNTTIGNGETPTTIGTDPKNNKPNIGPKDKPTKKPIKHHKIKSKRKAR